MTENELYDLVADFGQVCGVALRRDSYLTRGIDWPENWLELADIIGEERAQELCEGRTLPTSTELNRLIRWQVGHALDDEDGAITPTIWLCQTANDEDVIAVEGWGTTLNVELRFKMIGQYPTPIDALKELKKDYIFTIDDLPCVDEDANANIGYRIPIN